MRRSDSDTDTDTDADSYHVTDSFTDSITESDAERPDAGSRAETSRDSVTHADLVTDPESAGSVSTDSILSNTSKLPLPNQSVIIFVCLSGWIYHNDYHG